MSFLILVLVLVALIVVHEFGHFVVAKLSGMRVDEFGIGYPPRVWGVRKGETLYSVNALPFGGFVKIHGEDGESKQGGEAVSRDPRAFGARPRYLQALVLVAGIVMNILFAWFLFCLILFIGTLRVLDTGAPLPADAKLAVVEVVADSPAEKAGLIRGDIILSARYDDTRLTTPTPEAFTTFVVSDKKLAPVAFSVERDNVKRDFSFVPATGVISAHPERVAVGLAVATVGTVPLSLPQAIIEGTKMTWYVAHDTAVALYHFFGSIVTFTADFSKVSGPVGIAGALGHASNQGLTDLLFLVGVISINLALINFIPVPALDGGRLLFVLIEAVIRKSIRPGVAQAVNAAGFLLLILLMLVVTAHDIYHIVV